MIQIHFTAQPGAQTSKPGEEGGAEQGERGAEDGTIPGEIKDNFCLSWAGKTGY